MDQVGRLTARASRPKTMLDSAVRQGEKRIDLSAEHPSLRNFQISLAGVRDEPFLWSRYGRTESSFDYPHRYMEAVDIALAQYTMAKVPSKLADATEWLELAIELDLVYHGDNGSLTQEDERLVQRLEQGHTPSCFTWQSVRVEVGGALDGPQLVQDYS